MIPNALAIRAKAYGRIGEEWLSALPATLSLLSAEWLIEIGAPVERGTEALIAPVRLRDGREAMLKVRIPNRNAAMCELKTLLMAGGIGYVNVLAYSNDHQALLLERLGEPLADSGLTVSQQITCLCRILKAVWNIPVGSATLMSGEEKCSRISREIVAYWQSLGRPCDEILIKMAMQCAENRKECQAAKRSVLTHGDAHPWNALHELGANGNDFKLIDPDGLIAEPAYDLGVLLREWTFDLLCGDPLERAGARCEQIANLTGVDSGAIWEWGYIHLVVSGLFGLKYDDPEAAARIEIATALARADSRTGWHRGLTSGIKHH